jgi:hypothetical protein
MTLAHHVCCPDIVEHRVVESTVPVWSEEVDHDVHKVLVGGDADGRLPVLVLVGPSDIDSRLIRCLHNQ